MKVLGKAEFFIVIFFATYLLFFLSCWVCFVFRGSMTLLRLVEHEPAWELHLLLRFCKVAYTTDYSVTPIALGRPLPILIDENQIYCGQECYQYLLRSCSYYRMIEEADETVATYLQLHLQQLFQNYLDRSHTRKLSLQKAEKLGVQWQQSFLLDIKDLFFPIQNSLYPSYTANQIKRNLIFTFSTIDEKLRLWEDDHSLLSVWSKDYGFIHNEYGLADAIFYAQIARLFTHGDFAEEISQFEHIMRYFERMNSLFFQNGEVVASPIERYWQMSTLVLTNNPFLVYNPEATDLREALDIPEFNLIEFLAQQEISIEDNESQIVFFQSKDTNIEESQESTKLSALQSTIRSQQWIFPIAFQVAIGASFVTYFVHQYNYHNIFHQ